MSCLKFEIRFKINIWFEIIILYYVLKYPYFLKNIYNNLHTDIITELFSMMKQRGFIPNVHTTNYLYLFKIKN